MLSGFDDIIHLNHLRPARKMVNIYFVLLLLFIVSAGALPLIRTDISIKAAGIIRPQNERTETRAAISGIIDSVLVKDGQFVQKNQLILRIRDLASGSKRRQTNTEIVQRQTFIHDLTILTSQPALESTPARLHSPVYAEQLNHLLQQQQELRILLSKAEKEVAINTILFKDKVISSKEFFDVENNRDKVLASLRVQLQAQLSNWQQELARYRSELSQLYEENNEIDIQAGQYFIKAPVSGIVQGLQSRYSGGMVQANETICHISPEETLVGECLVSAKDVGLLHTGQAARFQVEAFDYKYFGSLTGTITSIDNDYTSVDNKPCFRVQCSFDSLQLRLKNGFSGKLKKGLNFQAAFTIARRSAWQLLFDKMDDWLNPDAYKKTA